MTTQQYTLGRILRAHGVSVRFNGGRLEVLDTYCADDGSCRVWDWAPLLFPLDTLWAVRAYLGY